MAILQNNYQKQKKQTNNKKNLTKLVKYIRLKSRRF